jgi:hypothetical protein
MKNLKFFRRIIFRMFAVSVFLSSFSGISVRSALAAAATIRYVAISGSDNGNCDSSTTPCHTIQYAVNKSSSGDTILVAQGTYTYSANVDFCTQYTSIRPASVICFVDKSLTILGGYSISNWATSNSSANLTVIDGESKYRGVDAVGYTNQETGYLDMEGFTIQNGLANGPSNDDETAKGGGMLVQHVALTLRDMVFKDNQVIGQIKSSGDGGKADGAGLRIEFAPRGSTSLLQRITFESNQSYGGYGPQRGGVAHGALYIAGSSATIEDAVFSNNLAQAGSSTGNGTSTVDGLQADALGGAIGIWQGGTLALNRITITGNRVIGGNAGQLGGGAFGAGILVEDTTLLTMSDAIIANNTATAGNAWNGGVAGAGGIHAQNNGEIDLESVKILSNVSTGGSSIGGGNAGSGAGGGIYLFATKSNGTHHATLTNVIVADNLAQQGNGITWPGNGGGGGIIVQGINADISHATIARNRIGSNLVCGEAMVVQPWQLSTRSFLPATVNLTYSITADHTIGSSGAAAIMVASGGFDNSATLNLNHGLFANNTINTIGSCAPAGTISTILSAASASFVSSGSPNYNFHIRLDSIAKDKAIGSVTANDIDGQTRPYNIISDYGADEYEPFPLIAFASDQSLKLDWASGVKVFEGGVNYGEIIVTCPPGAHPPDQGGCGQPINVGTATTFTLTGLSNFKSYTLIVNARDTSQNLLATSTTLTVSPTDMIIFLPLVFKGG